MGRTRLFRIKWDNRKLRHKRNFDTGECDGVHFSNGKVALANGMLYTSVYEMHEHFERFGTMQMTYVDEEETMHADIDRAFSFNRLGSALG